HDGLPINHPCLVFGSCQFPDRVHSQHWITDVNTSDINLSGAYITQGRATCNVGTVDKFLVGNVCLLANLLKDSDTVRNTCVFLICSNLDSRSLVELWMQHWVLLFDIVGVNTVCHIS